MLLLGVLQEQSSLSALNVQLCDTIHMIDLESMITMIDVEKGQSQCHMESLKAGQD